MSTLPRVDDTFPALVAAFRREKQNASSALTDWQYIRRAAGTNDQKELHTWKGKASLLAWLRVMGAGRPMQSGGLRLPQSLIDASQQCYEQLFAALGERFETESLNIVNALDFSLCSLVPNVRSILDYGAGYGRQAFLFSSLPGAQIFANDAVETSYFSQYWVFKTLEFPLWEYFDHASSLQEFLVTGKEAKVIHLPTWRNDLIPDHSLDLVLFVWCLSEMSHDAAKVALETCIKKLKPGGFVYIRDEQHSHGWQMEKQFLLHGFLPVYQPWMLPLDGKMNGTPRLYRYLPQHLDKRNTAYASLLFTAWRVRVFSSRQLLVRIRRALPF